ncbi:MAG: ABC transporter ATP-binding protein, partial [Kiritimatiellota bacterium]|nr:ABC transporter ATP-binding protein [Kiritimatiellota bacterium]
STHIHDEVEAICTRVIIIRAGSIVANASPTELKAKSRAHGAVELMVKSAPGDLVAKLERLTSTARVEVHPPQTTGGQMSRVVVYPRPSAAGPAQLAADILALVKANPGWELAALKTLEGRLDDVFRELTEPRN